MDGSGRSTSGSATVVPSDRTGGRDVRYGVVTEELASLAAATRPRSSPVSAHAGALRSAADTSGAWAVGRASTAARALFDTLAQAAAEAAAGLEQLGDQVAAAGGQYEAADGHLVQPP